MKMEIQKLEEILDGPEFCVYERKSEPKSHANLDRERLSIASAPSNQATSNPVSEAKIIERKNRKYLLLDESESEIEVKEE